ncbi:MAG: hypothetical protein V2I39_02320 [Erythrobacter sp.]|jgi:hypothetical protein|nr:hypothetical protein [Erythrobacter sp.]
MHKSLFNPKALMDGAFWSSKLGQAALASIAATSAMVVLTTQVGEASAASVAAPHDSPVLVEMA